MAQLVEALRYKLNDHGFDSRWCRNFSSAIPLSYCPTYFMWCLCSVWGHSVAQLVEALRYKPEDHGFDSRWCHWNFSLI